jgi:hypothetical protein
MDSSEATCFMSCPKLVWKVFWVRARPARNSVTFREKKTLVPDPVAMGLWTWLLFVFSYWLTTQVMCPVGTLPRYRYPCSAIMATLLLLCYIAQEMSARLSLDGAGDRVRNYGISPLLWPLQNPVYMPPVNDLAHLNAFTVVFVV